MRELFHTATGAGRTRLRPARRRAHAHQNPSVRALIARGAARLARAGVYFGHGTDNAWDEAAALVLHALGLPPHGDARLYRRRVGRDAGRRVRALLARRIAERIPAAYLTGVAWFAGVPLNVDTRVLIPRSPLAELIERRFLPWTSPARVRRVLDVGTGSGCIAIACALALPRARVDAVDISRAALEVARDNVRRHRLGRRVRLIESDYFAALGRSTYDIIVANPPYVGRAELRRLPPEYRHEPVIALAAGTRGLDAVRVILRGAAARLRRRGLLIVEVGNSEHAVRRAYPRLPFVWLEFARGGGGVFVLTREQLARA
ncbi:MAG: 50S ribosomal protein L3 N(5)-glutamine methyltransferase [Gammaproteobacteria bacterium]|nr:50S ribosomal protein L3 N(5)-glutamine methyltransferase [Gammaproteobacteria bacterium]